MILLVDDNQDLRIATRSMLEAVGFDVLEASDGQVAWQQFQLHSGEITTLLTDLRMPGLDGLQLIRKIRSQSMVPVVLMSTHLSATTEEELEQMGAVSLGKPFSVQQLQAALTEARNRPATLLASPAPARRRLWVNALAAGLVLALGLAGWFSQVGQRAPELPAPVLEEQIRGSEIKSLAPAGPVGSKPRQLSWKSLPAASAYRVEVTAVDGRRIWQGETAAAEIEIPEPVRTAFIANVAYYWKVHAYAADGSLVGVAAETRFRLIEPVKAGPVMEDS